ncbi:hypothetical protein [Micromonospora sp. NPDC005087]|uniref:hypothetical protein n=1 Tax=Micromonospora sp. NPDC005087 TaxID=3364225 RepID=UPI0036946644
MTYIVSRMVERRRYGLHTTIRLPEHPEMINFLREFAFPEALATALDTPLSELVTTDSLLRLALPDARPTAKVVLNSRPTLPFNYFPLEVVPLGRSTRHGPAVQYAATWLSRHVLSALDRDLGGQGSDVAQRVVLETLMAASVGREERVGIVAAHYGLQGKTGPCLEIAFWWDDGAAMPHDPQSDEAKRAINAANTSGRKAMESDAAEVLNLAAESPNAALATLQATDVKRASHLPLDGGLTVLGSAVTDIFHGRLDVYKKSIHFVLDARRQIDGGPANPVPEVTFNQSEGAEFFGNLIVVTLPFAG